MKLGLAKHLFWTTVLAMYVVSVALSYQRVYINQDYPIFYTEEEMPDIFEPLTNMLSIFK